MERQANHNLLKALVFTVGVSILGPIPSADAMEVKPSISKTADHPLSVLADSADDEENGLVKKVTEQLILELYDRSAHLNFGTRLSSAWQLENDSWLIAYQGAIFKKMGDEPATPWNTLESFNKSKLDGILSGDRLGVTVPAKNTYVRYSADNQDQQLSKNRIKVVPKVEQRIKELKEANFDPGKLTGMANYRDVYEIYRYDNLAIQYWRKRDLVEQVLIGEAAKSASLIPKEALLKKPTDDKDLINRLKIPFGGDVDQIIRWAAPQMGISEEQARRIVRCESTFDPTRVNRGSGASGLWQIMPGHAYRFTNHGWNYDTDRFDPYKNTVIATEIARSQGLGAWSCK